MNDEDTAGEQHRVASPGQAASFRVLVVEDTASVAELIRHSLESEGLDVEVVATLGDARSWLATDVADVVVLDIELPDGSGLDLLRDRTAGADVPVVILSGRHGEMDRVGGLELGAEDYVVKPFFPRELATRVRRAAARASRLPAALDFGGLRIDVGSREVVVDGDAVGLTKREFDLLVHLAASPRHVFHRDELLRSVWASSPEWQSAKTVTEHIRRVRRKIDVDGTASWIATVGRSGYRFEPR
jgi:two-component system phosphate regulon response regulator PhoB